MLKPAKAGSIERIRMIAVRVNKKHAVAVGYPSVARKLPVSIIGASSLAGLPAAGPSPSPIDVPNDLFNYKNGKGPQLDTRDAGFMHKIPTRDPTRQPDVRC